MGGGRERPSGNQERNQKHTRNQPVGWGGYGVIVGVPSSIQPNNKEPIPVQQGIVAV